MTISESIIKAAHEGIEAQQTISDIEKAARAIVMKMGFNPDSAAQSGAPVAVRSNVYLISPSDYVRPLWTFFTQEAEAALNAVHQ